MTVVFAAHSVSAALPTSYADDGDWAAGETNYNIQVLENDAEQAQECSGCGVARL